MGVISKQIAKQKTNRLIEPIAAPIGPWIDVTASAFPFLERDEILTLRALNTLLEVDVGNAWTSTLNVKGTVSKSQVNATSIRSLLRCEGGLKSGERFALGTCTSVGSFVTDWAVSVRVDDSDSATLVVDSIRTRDNEVPNAKLLNEVRDAITANLLNPPALELVPGLPELNELVTRRKLPSAASLRRDASPFANDFFVPLPSVFHDGARVELPRGAAEQCGAWLEAAHWPPTAAQVDAVWSADLSGGREVDSSALRFESTDDGDGIRFDLPNLETASAIGRQRTLRAAVWVLRFLVIAAEKNQKPEIAHSLEAYLGDCLALWQDPLRNLKFDKAWPAEGVVDVVNLGSGRRMPIGLHIRCDESISLFDELRTAQAWVTVRERTWTKGLRVESQRANRVYSCRRAMFLQQDDKMLPFLRYAQCSSNPIDVVLRGDATVPWFWECKLRTWKADGKVEALLIIDGLTQGDGIVAYGAELLTLLRAFAWKVARADASAEFQTLTLELH